ncbi:unnamed protein product [Caenorhabditis sp. 36 PRJEB53466]|nr:unnamed protein product [Caenorhabditis sp. 36 PRJEB53466]
MMDEEDVPQSQMVGKYEKFHERAIVGVWSFHFGGAIGVVTISHEATKLSVFEVSRNPNNVNVDMKLKLVDWSHPIQSCQLSQNGKYLLALTMDGRSNEIIMDREVLHKTTDFGYMEAVFCSIHPAVTGYIVSSGSNVLKDIEYSTGKERRTEQLVGVKTITCMQHSRNSKYIAIGQTDGAIDLLHEDTLKPYHKYEIHSMRIRKIEFLPDGDRFLTACDDRLIKLSSLTDFSNEADPTRSTKAIRIYSAHDSGVTGLTIDERSGGTRFASSSASAQIFIWHIELATPIIRIANDHTLNVSALSFAPTGRHLLSGGDEGLLQVYTIPGIETGAESPHHNAASQITQAAPQAPVRVAVPPALSSSSESGPEEPEHETAAVATVQSPEYQAPSEEQIQYYQEQTEHHPEESQQQPASNYQEYNPYAEPRTPPQEEEDIGDFVYDQQPVGHYQQDAPAEYREDEYNPEA